MSINTRTQKGFTLIEMMVSIALFAVVMTAAIGSILVISDSNKKARSLASVMTNLNFAVDSITRSFKTGEIKGIASPLTGTGGTSNTCISTQEINYLVSETSTNKFTKRNVTYCFIPGNATTVGQLTKDSGSGPLPITPPDVNITYLKFDLTGTSLGQQPILTITMEGTVKVSPKISSNFSIQTSVSQRKLNR